MDKVVEIIYISQINNDLLPSEKSGHELLLNIKSIKEMLQLDFYHPSHVIVQANLVLQMLW